MLHISLTHYSGVRDPGWEIDDLAAMKALVARAQGAEGVANGFELDRGMFVMHFEPRPQGLPLSIYVAANAIRINNVDKSTEYYRDSKGLRAYLIDQAIQQGIELPETVKSDLNNDAALTEADVKLLARDVGKSVSQSRFGRRCDYDADGTITEADVEQLSAWVENAK